MTDWKPWADQLANALELALSADEESPAYLADYLQAVLLGFRDATK